jgi:hypothetical protein
MKLLDNIIQNLLDKYVGGQVYFTALDKHIQHKLISDKLFSITSKNNIVIVSGGFGRFIKRIYPEKNILLLNGGLRHTKKINLECIAEKIKNKDFIFIDDSYYLGRTRNVIRAEIERLKGNFKHTYVIYDGSKIKDKEITSLYRYHDKFIK